ncbi:MAG: glycosyltransferase family 9 protein [Nevskia sp.]|nr:glycosyltransferase family 9 protein [Nevskia sp.]
MDRLAGAGTSVAGSGICIVRLDAIGDFVLWLDAAKELRRLYRDRRITLVANALWADLARLLPYWDEVLAVDERRFERRRLYRWRLLHRLSRSGFEIALQPIHSRKLVGDLLIRATGAAERIGPSGDLSNIRSWQKEISDRWYTRLLPDRAPAGMELKRNAELVADLGGPRFAAAVPCLPRLTELPRELHVAGPYFIVVPGAAWSDKRWPAERFAAVIGEFQRRSGCRPVLCGSEAEVPICAAVAAQVRTGTVDLSGRTSLLQLIELIRGASLVIGNDTSAVHIAAAVDTPAVAVLGGGHFGRFLPYPDDIAGCRPRAVYQPMECFGCSWQCHKPHLPGGPVPCVSGVAVEQVMDAALAALAQVSRGASATGA